MGNDARAPRGLTIAAGLTLAWFTTDFRLQLADVRHLLRSVRDLDRVYLEQWIARLDLVSLYREVDG